MQKCEKCCLSQPRQKQIVDDGRENAFDACVSAKKHPIIEKSQYFWNAHFVECQKGTKTHLRNVLFSPREMFNLSISEKEGIRCK